MTIFCRQGPVPFSSWHVLQFYLGACHRNNFKSNLQFSQSHLNPCSSKCQFSSYFLQFHLQARRRKKNVENPACERHIFIWTCRSKSAKNVQLAAATFSFAACCRKKVRTVQFQLSHFHLGPCHRKKGQERPACNCRIFTWKSTKNCHFPEIWWMNFCGGWIE